MKSYLKAVLGILFIIALSDVNAQIRSGYIFGLNLSTMTLKTKGISADADTPAGVHFGGIVDFPLNGNFAMQPGLIFSAKGADYKIDNVDFSISPIYIEIPVNAVWNFGSGAIKISLFAGPFLAFGIGGYKIESSGELKSINFGSAKNDDLRPFDYGVNFGAGVNIKGFLVSAQYGIGFANVSPVEAFYSEMKNKVIGISVCSLIARK